jgi:hypothetical protein
VLQSVYGNYSLDTIEFIAYDHYGGPDFSKYKNVLLFVSERRGKYIHEKYLFFDVYKTKDNRWAGPYSVRDLGRDNKRADGISAVKIDFEQEVSFPFSLMANKKEIPCLFPEPYYRLESDRAIAVYGNYIEELYKIEKEGVLTARGLFGKGKPGEMVVPETEIAEIKMEEWPSAKDEKVFSLFWKNLMKQPDSFIYLRLNNLSIQPSDLNERIKRILSTKAIGEFKKEDYREYISSYVTTEGPAFRVSKVVDTINTMEIRVELSFLKNKSGLRLSGVEEEKNLFAGSL